MTTATNPNRKKIKDKDFELVQAINTDQPELFHELVKRYEQKLYNFSLRMCRNPSDAEDLVQETFLNVFRYLKDFRYETKFKNWLYRIAASTCIKKRRRSKFAPERELSLEEFIPKNEAETQQQVPDWALMPLEKLLNEELANKVHQAILSLPDKYRLVIVLRDVEGFSTTETAHILNLSPSNVKVRLHRARLFLREKLKGYFEHGER
jgi:RNA polymerase sigma-70 factor (ECF subfamily)